MKRILSLVCVTALLLLVLAACGATEESTSSAAPMEFDASQLKTMGDVFNNPAVDTGTYQESHSETDYVYVFQVEDTYYRVHGAMTKELYDAVSEVDFEDEDRDQKIRHLLSPMEITSVENLSELIPPQKELDKFIGKTGQELFDDGWTYWYYNLEDMEAGLYYKDFAYAVRFEYDGEPMVNSDDFDFYEEFKDLKVSSVTFDGLGDAAVLEEEDAGE